MSGRKGGKPPGLQEALGVLFGSHPWHGVPFPKDAPALLTVYIEMVQTDAVKYELDKVTGLLKVDRPQKYSNVCPSLYGLVPRTLCAERIGALCGERTGRTGIEGDGDPLDVCVLTEKPFSHGNILVPAIPIGGLRMIDGRAADDKIVAVLQGDDMYGGWTEISECPAALIDRLRHYFLTYKQAPDQSTSPCEITHVYGREEAYEVIRRSHEDYLSRFGGLEEMLQAALKG
jgi:inorganic pyrophosphatase